MAKYFLEWSCKQKCFHIGDADDLCRKNLEVIIANIHQPDYRPIGIFNLINDASSMVEVLRKEFPDIFEEPV